MLEYLDAFATLNAQAREGTFGLLEFVDDTLQSGETYDRSHGVLTQYFGIKESLEQMRGIVHGEDVCEGLEKKLDAIEAQMLPELRTLDLLFRSGYHQPAPIFFDTGLTYVHATFREPVQQVRARLSGVSKPYLRSIDDVGTLEDLARYTHQLFVEQINSVILRWKARDHCIQPYKHTNVGVAHLAAIQETPMHIVGQAIDDYFSDADHTFIRMEHPLLTELFFTASMRLGHHRGFLTVLYDPASQECNIRWHLNEGAPTMQNRIDYCAVLFPLLGYHHEQYYSRHAATKRISIHEDTIADDLHREVYTMLLVMENMQDVDYGSRNEPDALVRKFTSWYQHHQIKKGRVPEEKYFQEAEFRERLAQRDTWTAQQEKILRRLVSDPYPMGQLDGVFYHNLKRDWGGRRYSRVAIHPALPYFLSVHSEHFFGETARVGEVQQLYDDALTVLFDCYDIQTSSWETGQRAIVRARQPFGNQKQRRRTLNRAFTTFQQFVAKQMDRDGLKYKPRQKIPVSYIRMGLQHLQGGPLYERIRMNC